MEHPFDTHNCIERLKKEYETHGKLVVGFDFDNTVYDCHMNGGNYMEVVKLLQRCKELGFILCLYTAEARPEHLNWKVMYCEKYKIKPDYINDSPLLGGSEKTNKPFFNILLDDRAGLESAFNTLERVVTYAEIKSMQSGKE